MVHERDVNAARNLQRLEGLAKAEITRGDVGPLLADVNCVASAVVEPASLDNRKAARFSEAIFCLMATKAQTDA